LVFVLRRLGDRRRGMGLRHHMEYAALQLSKIVEGLGNIYGTSMGR